MTSECQLRTYALIPRKICNNPLSKAAGNTTAVEFRDRSAEEAFSGRFGPVVR